MDDIQGPIFRFIIYLLWALSAVFCSLNWGQGGSCFWRFVFVIAFIGRSWNMSLKWNIPYGIYSLPNITELRSGVRGNEVVQLVEALRYKPEGREFGFRWVFSSLGVDQPLTEMSTGSISGRKAYRCVGLTTLTPCANFLEIIGASTSWIPQALSRPV